MATTPVLILLAFLTGALVPLQLTFNSQLGGVTRNAFTASLIVFFIGSIVLTLVVAITKPALPSLDDMLNAPLTIWLGGLIATVYIIAIVVLTPKLGVGMTTSLILVGQLITAILLDHFGAFGATQHSLNLWRVLGVVLMVTGVVAIKMN